MYYDFKGNIVQKHTRNHLNGTDSEHFQYSFTNQTLKRKITHAPYGGSTLEEEYSYYYDSMNRLTQTTHQIGNGAVKTLSTLSYDELGRMTGKNTGQQESATYEYNIRGWLRKINGNKFSQELRYTTHPHYGSVVNYNGNISAQYWKDPLKTNRKGFVYHYDDLGRVLNATYGEGESLTDMNNAYSEHIGYDKHGNMTYLLRPGKRSDGTFGNIDQLEFQSYDGNRLTSVHDYFGSQPGYDVMDYKNGNGGGTEMFYDSNGNLTKDLDKKISLIQYNYLNLPNRVNFQSGDWTQYLYDASGVKLQTKHYVASTGTTTTKDYVANKIYEKNVLKTILTTEGYVEKVGNQYDYYYFLKDHLGNNRVLLSSAGTAIQVNNYYAFGLSMWEEATNQEIQPYKYNGKELDKMHGLNLYDYGARMYDPAIGRFTTMDPLAEKNYNISPYAYCSNNPINRIDPTGMKDTTFVAGQDKPISEQRGTATPIQNPNGTINTNAYNCHSYAWENSQGDPRDPRNANLVQNGVTKWDNNPDNNMEDYTQLGTNDPNQIGDRVIYYTDANGNGQYDAGEDISHSAVVQTVDKNGNTTTVIGKMGQAGISENHPMAPGYYDIDTKGNPTSRAYFRTTSPSSVSVPTIKFTLPTPYVAPRNATYVSPPIVPIIIRR
jgi:RHS repeat-associated protein